MWIFSGMLLLIALVVPFMFTALAGWSGDDLADKRARLRGMFAFGCVVYAILVGLCVTTCWADAPGHHAELVLAWMVLWGIPLSSSAAAMLLFGRKALAKPVDPPDIGFSRSGL